GRNDRARLQRGVQPAVRVQPVHDVPAASAREPAEGSNPGRRERLRARRGEEDPLTPFPQACEQKHVNAETAEGAEKFSMLIRQPRKHEDTKKANVLFVFSCLRGCIFSVSSASSAFNRCIFS